MAYDFHFPTSKKALIIFTKNPELGRVKTRLAKTVGDENALEIYHFLVDHTASITKDLEVDKYVFYSDNIHKNDSWAPDIFRKKLQSGENLGERMGNAFTELFSMGYAKIIIIGCDMYDLEQKDIETAFSSLEYTDIVIGPATDGGYYLLGMKKFRQDVFKNKKWSTETVLRDTLGSLTDTSYLLLEERNDVDHYEDIAGNPVFEQILKSK